MNCKKRVYFCSKIFYLRVLASLFIFLFSFLGFAQDQKNIVLLDHWTDTTIVGGYDNAIFNDVWGFAQNGIDYCVIGSNIGSHFFKIENNSLQLVDFKAGKYQNKYVEHRDYKVYKNYLYAVCDEGTSSLQIFDLSYLPDSVHKVYDSSLFFSICHNIFIDTLNAKLYASGANNIGMQVIDITNPILPELNYVFSELPYVHDCYVRNDTAFLNAGFNGLYVYDFSGDTPTELGILDFYPNQGYNHSGWLSPKGDKYAFIDETKGTRIKLCTWGEDLSSIAISETFATFDYADYVPHNVIILDNLAFIAYYNEGFRIFDLHKAPFQEIGIYDTFLENTNYKLNGVWGVFVMAEQNKILISDRQGGLYLFEFPIMVLNQDTEGTFVTSSPFITENSVLIPRNNLQDEQLFFTISTTNGQIVYLQENYLNYVNIPLELSAGTYIYSIYDASHIFLESGKFIKAN